MKKKILRLFICFLATISCFLFNNDIVKADDNKITVDVNGKVGTGGKDPCDQNTSLVCIYNLPAVRISYYEGNEYIAGADFYEENAYSSDSMKNLKAGTLNNSLNQQRKGIAIEKSKSYLISMVDFDKTKFVSEENQKDYYNKIINALKKQDIGADINDDSVGDYHVELVEKILKQLGACTGAKDCYNKSTNTSNKLVIEPLYNVQIQLQSNALAGKGSWKYGVGTAYTIAHEIRQDKYYQNCIRAHVDPGTCKLGWKTRSDKNHVGRLANSLLLTRNWNGIARVGALRSGPKYSLKTIDDPNKGYGMAVVKFKATRSTSGKIEQYCYRVENDGCDSATGDYDISVESTDKIEDVATC